MRGRAWIKIGDIFEIPLKNKKKAFGQYVFSDRNTGPIIQIFDYIISTNQTPDIIGIVNSKLRFPPVYTGIGGIIKLGRWKVISHQDVTNYHFNGFLTVRWNMNTKVVTKWLFYDGNKDVDLGLNLPEKFRDLEWCAILSYDHIEKRIETGFSTFDFIKKHGRWPTKEEIPS